MNASASSDGSAGLVEAAVALAGDAAALLGADPPETLASGSPALETDEFDSSGGGSMYLVGLIGGKEVGKSALINALVGREVAQSASFGAGTERVLAYAHESLVPELEALLERCAPGKYDIVRHDNAALARQALLDLPDIDSLHDAHIELTRAMLRHILFPIWVQSVEKYADMKPRQLLCAVAEGNAAENFLFCLNKVDQLPGFALNEESELESQIEQLRQDFAGRLQRALELERPPQVWALSARHPDRFDFPEWRRRVMRQKSPQEIARARQAAARRQARSLLEWLDGLRIERRAEALQRLLEEAEAAVRSRIAEPLIARAIPAMLEDPGHRQALADEYMRERVRRWPILNALHGLIAPIAGMARTRLPRETLPGSELDTPGEEVAGRNLRVEGRPAAELIQSVFARLRQAHPALGEIYTDRKPWDEAAAREMAAALRQSLGAALESQRGMLRGQVRNPGGLFQALGRGVLTIGAAIWFPFAQPLLESYLSGDGFGGFALLLVQLLGVSALLKTIAFLAIYFAGLWVFLKWSAQRRVDGWIQRGRLGGDRPGGESPGLNALAAQWADGLCEPIRLREDALQALARRLDELKRQAAAPLADR